MRWSARSAKLDRPSYADIEGLASFDGPTFTRPVGTIRVDLDREAGGGDRHRASAAQFIPPVAEQAGHLTVFQRTRPG